MKLITALDIGASAIKLVQIGRSKGGIRLVDMRSEVYPREDALPVDDEAVLSCLKRLLTSLNVRARSAIVSIPRSSLTLKRLSNFPRAATDADLAALIPFQVEQELPIGPERFIYDYYGLRRDESKVSVELVAARREAIEHYMKLLKAVGVKVDAIYPSTFATYNLLLQQVEENGDKIIGAVDLGASRSELVIMRGRSLAFSTTFKWGGDDLTKLYQKDLSIDFKRAEEHKISLSQESEPIDSQASFWLDQLASEVSKAFYAFSSQNLIGNSRKVVDQLYLCGGSANINGIDEYLSQQLNIKTKIWNPLSLFEVKTDVVEKAAAGICVSLGSGVAAINDNVEVSLIPIEIKKRAAELRKKGLRASIAAILSLLLVLGAYGVRTQVRAKEAELNVLKLQADSAQNKLQEIRATLVKDLILQDMVAKRVSPLDVIKELSERLPDRKKVALTGFNLEKNGKVIVNLEASSNSNISEAIQAISASPLSEKVETGAISKIEKDKKQTLQIQVSFKLNPNPKEAKEVEAMAISSPENPQISGDNSDEKALRDELEKKKKELLGVK